ncbi:PucR family transcriptional regulator [Bifidobacterium apri]|uniref:PucR family transcriptional regulator n=1 Tax=Bifidobacterium apri TaxID=1769423 RepID=UPI003992655C
MASASVRPGSGSDRGDMLDLLMARLAALLGDDVLERDKPAGIEGPDAADESAETAQTAEAARTSDTSTTSTTSAIADSAAPRSPRPADARSLLESIVFACLAESTDDERVVSLMHMLGWPAQFVCCSIAGTPPSRDVAACAASIRGHLPPHADGTPQDCLIGEHDGHLVALIRVDDGANPDDIARIAETCFDGHEPICLGPTRQNADGASRAIRAAINALFALKACTREVPQPMRCEDLLPERALMGDEDARDELVTSIYQALKGDNPNDPTLQTVSIFLDSGASLDATARTLSVHPNTVRYRLKRATEICGWDATDTREAYVLSTAITLGRLRDAGLWRDNGFQQV